jgi:hypothetical protein
LNVSVIGTANALEPHRNDKAITKRTTAGAIRTQISLPKEIQHWSISANPSPMGEENPNELCFYNYLILIEIFDNIDALTSGWKYPSAESGSSLPLSCTSLAHR